MKRIKYLSFLILLNSIIACTHSQKHTDANNTDSTSLTISTSVRLDTDWIIGKWILNISSGYMIEDWKKVNDSTYRAKSSYIIGKDTASSTIVTIEKHGKEAYFIQKQTKKELRFKLLTANDNQLVFENTDNPYPQRISYLHEGNTLTEQVSGKVNDEPKSDTFILKKE